MTLIDHLWSDLERNLIAFLGRQPWFEGRAAHHAWARMADVAWLRSPPNGLLLVLVQINFMESPPEHFLLPLGLALGDRPPPVPLEAVLLSRWPTLAGPATVYDALADDACCLFLLDLMKLKVPLPMTLGKLEVQPTPVYGQLRGGPTPPMTVHRRTRTPGSRFVQYDRNNEGQLILKLYGKLESGRNPEHETGLFFAEKSPLQATPALAGAITYTSFGVETTLAIMHAFEQSEATGWDHFQHQLNGYLERTRKTAVAPDTAVIKSMLPWASMLGQMTAEMHLALAKADEAVPAFTPETFTANDLVQLTAVIVRRTHLIPTIWSNSAAQEELQHQLSLLGGQEALGARIRCHGDHHLGKVLFRKSSFLAVDFAADPRTPLAERRRKQTPLTDVAAMVRSFDYVARHFLHEHVTAAQEQRNWSPWIDQWIVDMTKVYLQEYQNTITGGNSQLVPGDPSFEALLWLETLHKALIELEYETINRPSWVYIPQLCLETMLTSR